MIEAVIPVGAWGGMGANTCEWVAAARLHVWAGLKIGEGEIRKETERDAQSQRQRD